MQTVVIGDDITVSVEYRDSGGALYDPAEVTLNVMRSAVVVVYGPYTYTGGDLEKVTTGVYRYTLTIESVVTPGNYSAQWQANVEGEDTTIIENFQVVDAQPEPSTLLDAPRTYGTMRESSAYRVMGLGLTDRVFLIGHATGLEINAPYQVFNMREAVNQIGADPDCPLLRALLEVYNAGGRDIWLVAAAPMTEFIPFSTADEENRFTPNDGWGGLNFYERYAERLESTYEVLLDYDLPQIMIPVEAPFYDTRGVDFLTPLVEHCASQFNVTGSPCIGMIGTRIVDWDGNDISAMANDVRLPAITEDGKFSMVIHGEGVYKLSQMPTSHTSPVVTSAAGELSTNRMNKGLTYQKLKDVVTLVGRNMIDEEISSLTNNRINPALRTQRGKRGESFQCVVGTDNTLGLTGTDFWSVVQVRLVMKVIVQVKVLGSRSIGTIGFAVLKEQIKSYLTSLTLSDVIRGYNFNMIRDPADPTKALVDISLQPYSGVRELMFQTQIGPGV